MPICSPEPPQAKDFRNDNVRECNGKLRNHENFALLEAWYYCTLVPLFY